MWKIIGNKFIEGGFLSIFKKIFIWVSLFIFRRTKVKCVLLCDYMSLYLDIKNYFWMNEKLMSKLRFLKWTSWNINEQIMNFFPYRKKE